jgi:hypothetical protein
LYEGTASYPKAKQYQKMKIAGMEIYESDSDDSDTEESGSEEFDQDEEYSEEKSQGQLLETSGSEEEQVCTEKNWWEPEYNAE